MITTLARRSSVHLDLVRGVAALAVFVGHARAVFLVDYQEIAEPNLFLEAVYWATGFGHQAVMIFFVLSGYFITSSIIRTWPRWSWREYLIDRLVRLYLVLLPGLVLTVLWDWIGRNWGCPALYEGRHPGAVFGYVVAERSDFFTFIVNVGFLQTVLAPPFGTNSPLWSLCNEFWYYLLFPCLLIVLFSRRPIWLRGAYALVVIGVLIFLGQEISLYFLVWLMGTVVRFLPPMISPRFHLWQIAATGLAAVAFLLALVMSRAWPGFQASEFAVGAGFAVWLYFMLHDEREGLPRWYTKLATTLAGGSYTLYVAHLPVLASVYSLLIGMGRWAADGRHLAALGLIEVGVFIYAYLLAQLTEANTSKVRRSVRALLCPQASQG